MPKARIKLYGTELDKLNEVIFKFKILQKKPKQKWQVRLRYLLKRY